VCVAQCLSFSSSAKLTAFPAHPAFDFCRCLGLTQRASPPCLQARVGGASPILISAPSCIRPCRQYPTKRNPTLPLHTHTPQERVLAILKTHQRALPSTACGDKCVAQRYGTLVPRAPTLSPNTSCALINNDQHHAQPNPLKPADLKHVALGHLLHSAAGSYLSVSPPPPPSPVPIKPTLDPVFPPTTISPPCTLPITILLFFAGQLLASTPACSIATGASVFVKRRPHRPYPMPPLHALSGTPLLKVPRATRSHLHLHLHARHPNSIWACLAFFSHTLALGCSPAFSRCSRGLARRLTVFAPGTNVMLPPSWLQLFIRMRFSPLPPFSKPVCGNHGALGKKCLKLALALNQAASPPCSP
jgi:hypothetical protein